MSFDKNLIAEPAPVLPGSLVTILMRNQQTIGAKYFPRTLNWSFDK